MLPLLLKLYVARLGESEIANHLGYINTALAGREYLLGAELTSADIQMSFVGEIAAGCLGSSLPGPPGLQGCAISRGGPYRFTSKPRPWPSIKNSRQSHDRCKSLELFRVARDRVQQKVVGAEGDDFLQSFADLLQCAINARCVGTRRVIVDFTVPAMQLLPGHLRSIIDRDKYSFRYRI
jgi:hypothetical protein